MRVLHIILIPFVEKNNMKQNKTHQLKKFNKYPFMLIYYYNKKFCFWVLCFYGFEIIYASTAPTYSAIVCEWDHI